ncbi:ABC transporter substrate-binding protein [Virgibacillus oceani]
MRKGLSLLALLLMGMILFLGACGSDETSGTGDGTDDGDTGDNSGGFKIGVLAPEVTHGWVGAVAYHAENRLEELSDEVDYQIQTSSGADEMTSQLDDLLTWGADAIVAFPQWEGMEVPIQNAIDQGVEVINFDIAIDVDGVYHVAGDNEDMGIQGANYIVDKIGTEGDVVIMEVPSAGSVSELRTQGFLDTMEEIAPDMNLMTYASEFTREAGLSDFADILTANDNIDAVYSLDDETSFGVLQAIQEAGRTDIQVVTGGGGMQEYFELMPENEDIWIQSALYSPAMVEDAVDVALEVLQGEDVQESVIIPTTVVDRDNYEEFLDADSPY